MKDVNEVMLNPIRGRIIQYIVRNEKATAGEIASFMSDVPKTTLYRHLNILIKSKVIAIVAENRVRGSVERTYALDYQAYSERNSKENAIQNTFGFLMKIYGDYVSYFSDENVNPTTDKIFLNNISLLLSDQEFDDFLVELGELIKKHLNNSPNGNRKQRSISIISSPCIGERKEENDNEN